MDHCEHLGHSLTAIATEKAAAIPPQATVISGAQAPEVQEALKQPAALSRPRSTG